MFRKVWHYLAGVCHGTIFRHYKGGVYRLIYIAEEATNFRKPVENAFKLREVEEGLVAVYFDFSSGRVHTRDLAEWNERITGVEGVARRFECVLAPPLLPWNIYPLLKE
jgi:hypothetical protein